MADAGTLGHTPCAVVYIGGKVVLVEDYQCTMTSKGEANTASVKIALENIESEVFANESVLDDLHEVEIWSGYIEDGLDTEGRLKVLKTIMSDIQGQKYLTKRFSGFVSQPEWSFGSGGRSLQLSCIDWTGILREYKLYKNFEDAKCEITNVISELQKDLIGLTIKLDPYNGSARLGKLDNVKHKVTYHTAGKTYWEVLRECAVKLGYIIITDHKTIHLVSQRKNPNIWNLYYGPAKKVKQMIQDPNNLSVSKEVVVGQFCDDIKVRYGQKGRVDKSNVVIELTATHHNTRVKKKKVEDKILRVIFPEDQAITSMTKYIKKYIPGNGVTEQDLKIIASDMYRDESKRLVTLSISLPFANNYMELWDIAELVIDASEVEAFFLNSKQFTINSITENYNSEGLKQNVELDSDPAWAGTAKRKFAPVYGNNRFGYVYGPNNTELGN